MEHGLVISRVYQVVEFTPNPCFADFTEEVSDARRRGDSDPRFEIFADTMKLIGNRELFSVNGYGHGFFVHGSLGRLFDRY